METRSDFSPSRETEESAIRAPGAYTSYELTKDAVTSMAYSLADRFGDDGIRVNAVMPGVVGTAAWRTPDSRPPPTVSGR